jgi:3-phenylpropionate/cinnamic acid dioxygenase small subunit
MSTTAVLDQERELSAAGAAVPDDALRREVEDFLFREAELADGHQFDAWLALWAPQAIYWVPCNEDDYDPRRHVSVIYEDRDKLEARLHRLKGKHAHAQTPRSRLVRVVSNIRIVEGDARTQIAVTANFVIGEIRLNQQQFWMGRYRYVLKRIDGKLRMAEKKVMLLANDAPIGNLTFVI